MIPDEENFRSPETVESGNILLAIDKMGFSEVERRVLGFLVLPSNPEIFDTIRPLAPDIKALERKLREVLTVEVKQFLFESQSRISFSNEMFDRLRNLFLSDRHVREDLLGIYYEFVSGNNDGAYEKLTTFINFITQSKSI